MSIWSKRLITATSGVFCIGYIPTVYCRDPLDFLISPETVREKLLSKSRPYSHVKSPNTSRECADGALVAITNDDETLEPIVTDLREPYDGHDIPINVFDGAASVFANSTPLTTGEDSKLLGFFGSEELSDYFDTNSNIDELRLGLKYATQSRIRGFSEDHDNEDLLVNADSTSVPDDSARKRSDVEIKDTETSLETCTVRDDPELNEISLHKISKFNNQLRKPKPSNSY